MRGIRSNLFRASHIAIMANVRTTGIDAIRLNHDDAGAAQSRECDSTLLRVRRDDRANKQIPGFDLVGIRSPLIDRQEHVTGLLRRIDR